MYMKMSDLTEVINGYAFRGAIETIKDSDSFVLQAKDIIQGQNITDVKKLTPISFTGTRTASFLQKNDIVIVSRGMGIGSFRSAIFDSDNSNVIASSSLLIVRIKKKDVFPEYVSLYFNSTGGQSKILETVSGSYIQAISRRKFAEEIKIPIPPLKVQQSIINLNKNIELQKEIYDKKKQLNQEVIAEIIKKLTNK